MTTTEPTYKSLAAEMKAAKAEANALYKERLADIQVNTKMAQRRAARKAATDEYNLTLSEIKVEYKEGLKQVKAPFLKFLISSAFIGIVLAIVLPMLAPPTPEQKNGSYSGSGSSGDFQRASCTTGHGQTGTC